MNQLSACYYGCKRQTITISKALGSSSYKLDDVIIAFYLLFQKNYTVIIALTSVKLKIPGKE
jgi:hypothetical protein